MINEEAISLLSSPLKSYFIKNKYFISENSMSPDLRKRDTVNYPGESHGHYIDLDFYDEHPFVNIPRNFNKLIEEYGIDKINKWGSAPWRIEDYFNKLIVSFKHKQWKDVKIIASSLGHYVSDIHVPLHTTKNYNGQLTNNKGIHKRWEVDLFEYLLMENINIKLDNLYYFENPVDQSFIIAIDSFSYIDKILLSDTNARLNVYENEILNLENRNQLIINDDYFNRFYDENKSLIISQIEKSIISVASFWERAWILSGRPSLP